MKLFIDGDNDILYLTKHISFEHASIDECDYILSAKFPWGITHMTMIQSALDSYKDCKKKVLVFLISDSSILFNIPDNVYLFRTSLQKSIHIANEYILPYIWDGVDRFIQPLEKKHKPIVGFCGMNNTHRNNTLIKLGETEQIVCNFLVRKQFWGGAPHDKGLIDDFENNIENSHYTLCNRGAGNFSMRFYQVLSAGRIPIFVNTDMKMPFENEIDWKAISVSGNNDEELIANLISFNNAIDIVEVQKKCKYIYDTFFSPEKYFVKLFTLLDKFVILEYPVDHGSK